MLRGGSCVLLIRREMSPNILDSRVFGGVQGACSLAMFLDVELAGHVEIDNRGRLGIDCHEPGFQAAEEAGGVQFHQRDANAK